MIEPVAHQLDLFADPEFNPALRAPSWMGLVLAAVHGLLHPQSSADARRARPAADLAGKCGAAERPAGARRASSECLARAGSVVHRRKSGAGGGGGEQPDGHVHQVSARGEAERGRQGAHLAGRARCPSYGRRCARRKTASPPIVRRQGLVRGVHAGLDTEQVSQLTEDLARARADLASAEGRQDAARNHAGAATLAGVAPSVVQLREQTAALAAQLQSLNARLGPNHPDVVALRREIEQSQHDTAAETARVVAATEAEVTRRARPRCRAGSRSDGVAVTCRSQRAGADSAQCIGAGRRCIPHAARGGARTHSGDRPARGGGNGRRARGLAGSAAGRHRAIRAWGRCSRRR